MPGRFDGEAGAVDAVEGVDAGFDVVGGGAVVGVADDGGELEMGVGVEERGMGAGEGEGGFEFVAGEGTEAVVEEYFGEGEVVFGRGRRSWRRASEAAGRVGGTALGRRRRKRGRCRRGRGRAGRRGRGCGGVEGVAGGGGEGVELGDDRPADESEGSSVRRRDEGGVAGAVGEVGEHGDVVGAASGVVVAVLGEDALDFAGVGGFGPGEFEDEVGGAARTSGLGERAAARTSGRAAAPSGNEVYRTRRSGPGGRGKRALEEDFGGLVRGRRRGREARKKEEKWGGVSHEFHRQFTGRGFGGRRRRKFGSGFGPINRSNCRAEIPIIGEAGLPGKAKPMTRRGHG